MPSDGRQLRVLVRRSDAEKDVRFANELVHHFSPLEVSGLVTLWSDDRIRAGEDVRQARDAAIGEADVVLLLLSPDFLAADALLEEVPRLLARHEKGALRVVPLLLRSCLWEVHPWLKDLKPLPKGGKPIGAFSEAERDAVLTEVVREIVGRTTIRASEDAAPGPRQPAGTLAMPPPGGSTFHVTIEGSTIGSLAFGEGTSAKGSISVDTASSSGGPMARVSTFAPTSSALREFSWVRLVSALAGGSATALLPLLMAKWFPPVRSIASLYPPDLFAQTLCLSAAVAGIAAASVQLFPPNDTARQRTTLLRRALIGAGTALLLSMTVMATLVVRLPQAQPVLVGPLKCIQCAGMTHAVCVDNITINPLAISACYGDVQLGAVTLVLVLAHASTFGLLGYVLGIAISRSSTLRA